MEKTSKQREILAASEQHHKASSQLAKSLLKEKKQFGTNYLATASKKKLGEITKPMTLAQEMKEQRRDEKGLIKALGNYKQPVISEPGKEMIKKQKESRRERHLDVLKNLQKRKDELAQQIDEKEVESIEAFKIFQAGSNQELEKKCQDTFDLVGIPIEFIKAGWKLVESHIEKRNDEFQDLIQKLYHYQKQRAQRREKLIDDVREQLIDIAFILEPEVVQLLETHREENKQDNETQMARIAKLLDQIKQAEYEQTEEWKKRWGEIEDKWKTDNHNAALRRFSDTLNSAKYVNPAERVKCLNELKEEQRKIYENRLYCYKQINEIEIPKLSKAYAEQIADKIREMNERSQQIYDSQIQNIVELQRRIDGEVQELFQTLKIELQHYQARIPEQFIDLDDLLKKESEPLVNKRKEESKQLLSDCIAYIEFTDMKAHEALTNISNFLLKIAEIMDQHRENYQKEQQNYELSLAVRQDQLDETIDNLEQKLQEQTELMRRAVQHIVLNESLQDCYGTLDDIAQEYRKCCSDMIALINKHPTIIKSVFLQLEVKVAPCFHLFENLTEQEKEQQQEENAVQYARWKFKEGCIEYYVKQSFEATGNELLETEEEREIRQKEKEEQEKLAKEREEQEKIEADQKKTKGAKAPPKKPPTPGEQKKGGRVTKQQQQQEDKDKQKKQEEEQIQLETSPPPSTKKKDQFSPCDPDGNECLQNNVLFTNQMAIEFLMVLLKKLFLYRNDKEDEVLKFANEEDRQKEDTQYVELDDKLRLHWPRKGRLEVGVFQERSSQIATHKQKYERHVRFIYQRNDQIKSQFEQLQSQLDKTIIEYEKILEDQTEFLTQAVNLAQLQGANRKVKEAFTTTGEILKDLLEQLFENASVEELLKMNEDFFNACPLIEGGGNYSQSEIEWYREMMSEVNKELDQDSAQRQEIYQKVQKDLLQRKQEPYNEFEKQYGKALEDLAAREGLGKKYGAPRRGAQEKLRAEMSKCEAAQKGILQIYEQLKKTDGSCTRKFLQSFFWCSYKFGVHLNGFVEDPQKPELFSYEEEKVKIQPEQNPQEMLLSLQESLGVLGINQNQLKFTDAVNLIEKQSKEECQKLYTGKVFPEFMTAYLEHMQKQAENFRLNSLKELRAACENLIEQSPEIPIRIFHQLNEKTQNEVYQKIQLLEEKLLQETKQTQQKIEVQKRKLRPNLSNPACRQELEDLILDENQRHDIWMEKLKKYKADLLLIWDDLAMKFFRQLTSNSEVFIAIFDVLLIKANFIFLPGDEAVEQKRTNIKRLLRKKLTGKENVAVGARGYKKTWPGLDFLVIQQKEDQAIQQEVIEPKKQQQKGGKQHKEEAQDQHDLNKSKDISGYKMSAQKMVISERNKMYSSFKEVFTNEKKRLSEFCELLMSEEEKWFTHFTNTSNKFKTEKTI